MRRAPCERRTLDTPVVSVGGLTMGGAGKSPMVAHLARRLREMGRNPAILTRGYKRVSREPIVIVPRGGNATRGEGLGRFDGRRGADVHSRGLCARRDRRGSI